MATEILNVTSEESYGQSIRVAARTLQDGGLIVIPTETVYGLAASAECPDAVQRLRGLKGREGGGPFTVHLGAADDAGKFLNRLTPFQRRFIDRSWPGPLTLVFEVPHPEETAVAAGRDDGFIQRVFHEHAVGLRCPDCAPARDLLTATGGVVLASSANARGQQPPTTAEQARAALGEQVDLILDGGPCKFAAASTIVRLRGHEVEVLRSGALDERTVRKLTRTAVLLVCTGNTCRSPMAEGLLRHLLAEHLACSPAELDERGFEIRSAGTFAAGGSPATPEAVQAMSARGIDISRHRSTPLTPEMVQAAQIVLAMTRSHLAMIESLAPQVGSRCRLLAGDRDVSDPIGGSLQIYEACRDQIEAALKQQITEFIL